MFVEQFEKCVDTLHQLAPDLCASALDQMHRDTSAAAVGKVDPRVLDTGDSPGIEDAHPIDQRSTLRRPFHQSQLTRHQGLPRAITDGMLYSISVKFIDKCRGQPLLEIG